MSFLMFMCDGTHQHRQKKCFDILFCLILGWLCARDKYNAHNAHNKQDHVCPCIMQANGNLSKLRV